MARTKRPVTPRRVAGLVLAIALVAACGSGPANESVAGSEPASEPDEAADTAAEEGAVGEAGGETSADEPASVDESDSQADETDETDPSDPSDPTGTDGAASADSSDDDEPDSRARGDRAVTDGRDDEFGSAPPTPSGPLTPELAEAIETAFGQRLVDGVFDTETFAALRTIGASADPRAAWLLTDLLRVARNPDLAATLTGSLTELLGVGFNPFDGWGDSVDHLIAWDIAAPPDYLQYKRNIYLLVESGWEPLMVDAADIDWRHVSWGGVRIDDRPYDQTDTPCNCIPAVDNPRRTDVTGGDEWLDADTIVFGVVIGDEARAYPRSIMEVREMVNDTLGGRDIAMPYCTLCGSAQVYFTDDLPAGFERPVLRTSGLLIRSNKVMYDVVTQSIFDTFLGRAVSGPLYDAGIELEQNSVITTTWGEWKSAYPDTTVLAIEEALGRPDSDLRNTRDADGPIFPIGGVDPRLGVQDDVLGLFTADGTPIAFEVAAARAAIAAGETVQAHGITLVLDGGGVAAVDNTGQDLGAHQAFWFAWSQFHPDTLLWPG